MMRRGPLDRYPAEWVLRQAQAHGAGGCIEFHTEEPATLFLDGGRPYLVVDGTGPDAAAAPPPRAADEARARTASAAILARVLGAGSGWYFHDPLAHHPARGLWRWDLASLLMDTRARAHEHEALGGWSGHQVRLGPVTGPFVTVDADAWELVVGLAQPVSATDLAHRLGWTPDRVLTALNHLHARGVLTEGPTQRPAIGPLSATPPMELDGPVATGPLTAPAEWNAEASTEAEAASGGSRRGSAPTGRLARLRRAGR